MNINENIKTVLRWGIASAGLISQDFCTALASFESKYHVFQAVGARNLSDAQKFAERFGFASFYNSYDELCNDKLVDIIYVGSINTAHNEIALKAIEAGKHVLCEKPACMTLKDLNEVLDAAKAKKVFFMEAMWTRHFPILSKLKHEIEENKAIGELKFLTTNFMVPINHVDRLKNKKLGGGAILDIGIYTVQMATLFFNHEEPIKITASGHLMESGVDECCTITLLYPNQRIGQINISTNCGRMAKTFLVGDKGVAEIPDFSWCPTEYILNGAKYSDPLPPCAQTNFDSSVGLRFQAEAAREAITKGWLEHPKMTHDISRHIMRIMEEANKQLDNVY